MRYLQTRKQQIISLLILSLLITYLFYVFLPEGVDWINTFFVVAKNPFSPYQTWSFINPPWVALLLTPLGLLPARLSGAVNASITFFIISIFVVKEKGKLIELILVLTSLPFLAALYTGTIEWIPVLAFLLPAEVGMLLLLAKPQSGIFAGLIWWKKSNQKLRLLLFGGGALLVSFLVWGNWIEKIATNIRYMDATGIGLSLHNASPWPWGIPVGLFLLYLAWKKSDELLAVIATMFLVPYYVIHSLTLGFACVVLKNRRVGVAVWLLLWFFAIYRSL
ncbi:MAG: hypothetical protein WHV44_04635 [Anaerolineales bacterium]